MSVDAGPSPPRDRSQDACSGGGRGGGGLSQALAAWGDRRDFLRLCGVGLGALLASRLLAAGEAAAVKPNFLWIVAEDMGPALGCYGRREVKTPNLDRMATAGCRYDRFYTTAPVCSASRSAFMTGMYQTSIDAQHHRSHREGQFPLPAGVRTLPEIMAENGYLTANLVEFPEACGVRGTGKNDWNFTVSGKPFVTKSWADLAGKRPFFAQLNFWETHRAFKAPKVVDPAAVELPPYYPDHPVVRADYAKYLDCVVELDRKVGLVLAQLEADGLAENTVVIFMGDNGEAHIRGKQFCYEEGLHVPLIIRWPKTITPPAGFVAGKADDQLLAAIDLTATFLSLAGIARPEKMQGRSFLGEARAPEREYIFGARDRCDETAMRIRTVRDRRYRYIRNFTPEVPFLAPNEYKSKQYPLWDLLPKLKAANQLTAAQAALCAPRMADEELYDLEKDPHEIHNLAGVAEHATALKRMRGVLDKWIEATSDCGRIPEVRANADPKVNEGK